MSVHVLRCTVTMGRLWDAFAALAPACGCGPSPTLVLRRLLLRFLPSLVSPACMRFTQAYPSRVHSR
eukprot:359586-Chlamydomonas_euryale.AAC.19